MNIDKLKEVLTEFEGVRLKAYIPKRGGLPIQSSGVTIGKGLDLGQQSVESLRRMNIPDYLIERFKPYLGLKGRDAAKALALATREKRVPTITREEEKLVSDNSVRDYAKNFQADFKRYVGYDVSELSENQQLALASMYFQNGVGSSKSKDEGGKTGLFIRNAEDSAKYGSPTTNFLKQLQDRDFEKAAGNISTWSNDPSLKERNWVTSLLFLGGLDSDQLQEGRKFVQDREVQASLKQGQLPEELTAPFVTAQPEGVLGAPFERVAPLNRVEPTVAPADLQDWQEPGAFELAPTQPQYATMEELLKAKGEPQYNTMEDLLMDRGLMNPLRSNKGWIVG
jgi:GH24 family phage-related lysozyme (muramidase)